jgi:hypothetical protein
MGEITSVVVMTHWADLDRGCARQRRHENGVLCPCQAILTPFLGRL